MKLKIKQGQGAVIGTHIGQGDERRMLFITPWGCSLSIPPKAPTGADLTSREYVVEVSSECERLIRAAIAAKHQGLVERVEILPDAPETPAPAKGKK